MYTFGSHKSIHQSSPTFPQMNGGNRQIDDDIMNSAYKFSLIDTLERCDPAFEDSSVKTCMKEMTSPESIEDETARRLMQRIIGFMVFEGARYTGAPVLMDGHAVATICLGSVPAEGEAPGSGKEGWEASPKVQSWLHKAADRIATELTVCAEKRGLPAEMAC
jgi:hypothetical protein